MGNLDMQRDGRIDKRGREMGNGNSKNGGQEPIDPRQDGRYGIVHNDKGAHAKYGDIR